MNQTLHPLKSLLRRELTAVNQQFMHILTLRAWGEEALAARITEIDNTDFATSMKIMDLLVERNEALNLPSESFAPGCHIAEILTAEEEMEKSLTPLVEGPPMEDLAAQALVETEQAPRAEYRKWLRQTIEGGVALPKEPPSRYPETSDLFSHLMVMLEQSMAHAFIHWHRGTKADADLCWAASGEAMMLATAMDKRFAALNTAPLPAETMPQLSIAETPADTHGADQALAERCASEARRAADTCGEPKIARLCAKIADYAETLAAWRPGQDHPAVGRNKTFDSFARTYGKFVKPTAAG